jgi:hypothetical protein
VYRVLAFLIALEVAIQAAVMVYAVAGLIKWVDGGGTLDKAALESDDLSFPGLGGIIAHGMNGMMVIPALAVILLIVSFFAKVPGGVLWAGLVLLAVVVQVLLGLFGHEVIGMGALHGVNALILFGVAVMAGIKAGRTKTPADRTEAEALV